MPQLVTQEMRDAVSRCVSRLERYPRDEYLFSDPMTHLIYHEMTSDNPRVTLEELINVLKDVSEEELVFEYVALKEHFNDNHFVNMMLLRGLHRHKRNSSWMDPSNPESVQRNVALIKAIMLLRASAYERLLKEALEYNDYGEEGSDYGQCFREPECVDLIIDYPEHYEKLIVLMLERGYQTGMMVFRELMKSSVPALNTGVL